MILQYRVNNGEWQDTPGIDEKPADDNGENNVEYRVLKTDGTLWGRCADFDGIFTSYTNGFSTVRHARRLTANRY